MNTAVLLLIAFVLISVNAFFVAVEFALMVVRRTRIEAQVENNVVGARSVLRALDSINVQLAASQLGISVVSLLIGWLVEPVISSAVTSLIGGLDIPTYVIRGIGLVVGLGLVAFVHMVLGEMVPRSIALSRANRTARTLVPVHLIFVAVTGPVVRLLHWLGRAGTRLVGVEPIDELAPSHTASELAAMVDEAHASGNLEPSDHDLLSSALSFRSTTVAEVMARAESLVTIPRDSTIGQAEELMHASGHSRVLVMGASSDQVVGFLHAKDLIGLTEVDRTSLLPPGLIRGALIVGPQDVLDDVMLRMRRVRVHVAVVMSDGRMVGLVTLEDVIEAIVGDIRDESDMEADHGQPDPGEYGEAAR